MELVRWQNLMQSFGISTNESTYQALQDAYSETHRRYHTAEHIKATLRHLDTAVTLAKDVHEVEMALWFHDAVYKPLSATNEFDSAVWAVEFLSNNGPWNQLVRMENVSLNVVGTAKDCYFWSSEKSNKSQVDIFINKVPHRDEFSETVGYRIEGNNKNTIFIPDIDKWEKWDRDIKEEIRKVDYAFIDGTFYDGNELPGRDMKEIPHPLIIESMELFKDLSAEDKKKIHFIHFNHTNPLLNKNSPQYKEVIKRGYNIANYGDVFEL